MSRSAFIVSAVRTPIGVGKPRKGALYPIAPVDLAAQVLKEALLRAGVQPGEVEDVIMGCVTPIGDQGANIGRLAALKAGFPVEVPGIQINRMCGSGQQAVHFATQAILAGDVDMVLAGGVEMMSHQPIGTDWPDQWPHDFPHNLVHQGMSAELMAEKWSLEREALDDFAFQSHQRAAEAIQHGRQARQITPVRVRSADEEMILESDEGVRMEPDREKMRSLSPVFKDDGVITAANSSQISDGAAALLVVSEQALKEHNLSPIARIVARAVVGSDPVLMLDAPIPATRSVLQKAGMQLEQIDLIEINEAFASVVLAWMHEIRPDPETVNPDGGAIAHGHPLGATGAVLMTKLVHELDHYNRRYGLQTMCIGHGMATATILERV